MPTLNPTPTIDSAVENRTDADKPPPTLDDLLNSETHYRRIFESARDGILILDEDTLKIIDVNPFMMELLGYSRAEFVGKELWEIGLFRDKEASQAAFRELQDTGYIRYEDLPLQSTNGERREVEFVSNVYVEAGRRVIQCSIRDITERRLEEVARERLAAIVKSSGDAIISKDLDGVITTWNSAAEKMFGYLREEIIGKPGTLLFPPDRVDEELLILARIVQGEGLDHFETVRVRKDGMPIDVSVTISPIMDEDGKIIGASKIARDISELKRVTKEIRELNADLEQRVEDRTAELEAANKELEAFSYSVSHDLRAPLRHMNGFSQALLEDYADKLDDVGKGYLKEVREASREMAQLIDDVLKLAVLNQGEMVREKIDLSELVASVFADIQAGDPKRIVNISIEKGLTTYGDRRLIGILLTNLLENAWKFSSNQRNAEIVFGREEINGKSGFFVRDNGAGFDMAYADKLFGAFQRLHGTTEFEGTGIGLATVQRIINRHGGRVWADGAVNRGATFFFSLPGEKN